MARWIVPLLLTLAALGSFVGFHPRTRPAVRSALAGLRRAVVGPTADELLQDAIRRFNLAEYHAAGALCRTGLRKFPSHLPFLQLLGRIPSPEILSRLISMGITCRHRDEATSEQHFRELLDLERQAAER
jgi:hypothetical protein